MLFFIEKPTLELHMKIVHGNRIYNTTDLSWYACLECCNSLYKREQDIKKHMYTIHNEMNIKCENFFVTSIMDITFSCRECGKKCVFSKSCIQHSSEQTKLSSHRHNKCKEHVESHTCQYCKILLENCDRLWCHLLKVHSDKVDEFKCNICTKSDSMIVMKHVPVIITHMKMEHGIKVSLITELSEFMKKSKVCAGDVTKFKCFECCTIVKTFNTLRTHYMNVHYNCKYYKFVAKTEKPHKCNICGRSFSDKRNLDSHFRIHTGDRRYVCEICGAAFIQWASLYYHKLTHSDNRLPCSLCEKTFSMPKNLKNHMNMHTGNRIFVCEECGKQFRSRETWKYHAAFHSKTRPFVCEHCSASFKVKKHLTQHYKTHFKKI